MNVDKEVTQPVKPTMDRAAGAHEIFETHEGNAIKKSKPLNERAGRWTKPLTENDWKTPEKQDESKYTYAKMLKKEMGNIDFSKSAYEIECLVRGLNPWPSAFTGLDGKTLKIWSAKVLNKEAEGEFGEIVEVTKEDIMVKTGNGILQLKEVQLEGKKRMDTGSFLRGYQVTKGTILKK